MRSTSTVAIRAAVHRLSLSVADVSLIPNASATPEIIARSAPAGIELSA